MTTWKFRLAVLFVVVLLLYATHAAWLTGIGSSLIHEEHLEPADVILIENFDAHYLVFETASRLLHSGYADRALVPVLAQKGTTKANLVEQGVTEVMSRIARIENYEILPVRQVEPISLNTAHQIADYLEKEGLRSVIVVSPKFRSARSYLVYSTVFTPRGIRVQCQASNGGKTAENWWHTWHGIQDVGLEGAKLLYYRLWVLR